MFRIKPFELGSGNATWLLNEDFTYRSVSKKEASGKVSIANNVRPYNPDNLISQGRSSEPQPFSFRGIIQDPWPKKFALETKLSSWNESLMPFRAYSPCF